VLGVARVTVIMLSPLTTAETGVGVTVNFHTLGVVCSETATVGAMGVRVGVGVGVGGIGVGLVGLCISASIPRVIRTSLCPQKR
jgi:hypothetical protein